jgi:cyclase
MVETRSGMVELARGVYAYVPARGPLGGSNAGLIVGDREAIAIDALASERQSEAFLVWVRACTDRPIRYVVLTHHHEDHCLGAHAFTGATVISHARCRDEMRATRLDLAVRGGRRWDIELAGVRYALPDVTFEDEVALHLGSRRVYLIHHGPAHTSGDAVAYLPDERIVFAGDLVSAGITPYVGDGSFSGWIQVLYRLLELDARAYVPGHGPVTTVSGVFELREYLGLVYREGCQALAEGLSPEEAAERIHLGRYADWQRTDRLVPNLRRLYRELDSRTAPSPCEPCSAV